ncbi:hypothetical protein SXCC_03777 [Gluconacetobacter sp. SXCC-1]|nr:hypothetical protein SXCC_03777 [Gluconacetobacter sp. SXCC-1]
MFHIPLRAGGAGPDAVPCAPFALPSCPRAAGPMAQAYHISDACQ